MDALRDYLLRVICAATACGIVGSIVEKKGSTGVLIKLTSGIFLAFTVISPIAQMELEEMSIFTSDLQEAAASASAYGQAISEESLAAFIKSKTEAYILDKAAVLNVVLTTDITLGPDLRPESVRLRGTVPPYAKYRLEAILEEDLGIVKENQLWIE